jgi:hypothetical protein
MKRAVLLLMIVVYLVLQAQTRIGGGGVQGQGASLTSTSPQNFNGAVNSPQFTASGLPTGCAQYPCIVAKLSLNNITANTGTSLYTPATPGTYVMICTAYVITAGTAGTIQCGSNWRTGGSTNSSQATNNSNAITTTGIATQNGYFVEHVDGLGVPITYFVNINSATGSPVIGADFVLMRLQ